MKIFSVILAYFFFSLTIQTEMVQAEMTKGAAEVFISFAKESLGEEYDSKMGPEWEKGISFHTRYWSKERAFQFLTYLEARIGKKAALQKIKPFSRLSGLAFDDFLGRIHFYEGFLGPEGVTERLKKSLLGFDIGNAEEMEKVVKYVENLVGRKALILMMKRNLNSFSEIRLLELRNNFKYITSLIGEEEAKILIEKNFLAFKVIGKNIKRIKENFKFLKAYIESSIKEKAAVKEILTDMITSNFRYFFLFDSNKFEKIRSYLKNQFSLSDQEIIERMRKNLLFFSQIRIKSLKDITGVQEIFTSFVKKHLTEDEYNSQFGVRWENKISFYTRNWSKDDADQFLFYLEDRIGAKAALETLKVPYYLKKMSFDEFLGRIHFYEGFLGPEGVTKRLKKSLAGFHYGNAEEMEKVVNYVENLLGREVLILMMKKNLIPFSEIHFLELRKNFEYIVILVGIKRAKMIMERTLSFFREVGGNTGKIKENFRFIKNYIENSIEEKSAVEEILIDMITSNPKAFYRFDPNRFEQIRSLLKTTDIFFDEEIIQIMQQNLAAFSQINSPIKLIQAAEIIGYINHKIYLMFEVHGGNLAIVDGMTANVLKKNPSILSTVNLMNLKQLVTYLENYIGEKDTNYLMAQGFLDFYKMNFNDLIKIISLLENLFGKLATRQMIVDGGPKFFKLKKTKLNRIMNWMKPPLEGGFLFLKDRAAQKELLSFFDYMNDLELEEIKSNAQKKQVLEDYLNSQKSKCAAQFAN